MLGRCLSVATQENNGLNGRRVLCAGRVGRKEWQGWSGIRVRSNFPDTPVVGFTESFVFYVNRSAPDMRIPGNR